MACRRGWMCGSGLKATTVGEGWFTVSCTAGCLATLYTCIFSTSHRLFCVASAASAVATCSCAYHSMSRGGVRLAGRYLASRMSACIGSAGEHRGTQHSNCCGTHTFGSLSSCRVAGAERSCLPDTTTCCLPSFFLPPPPPSQLLHACLQVHQPGGGAVRCVHAGPQLTHLHKR